MRLREPATLGKPLLIAFVLGSGSPTVLELQPYRIRIRRMAYTYGYGWLYGINSIYTIYEILIPLLMGPIKLAQNRLNPGGTGSLLAQE
jgi:hypothetical protein